MRPELDGVKLRAVAAALLTGLGCTTISGREAPTPRPSRNGVPPPPAYDPLPAEQVRVAPEGITVESSWILHLYTLLHARTYSAQRVEFPGADGQPAIAHLLLPPGEGPHPAVVVFPILAGSHVVSEGLAKALVRRGFAVLRFERQTLGLEEADHPDVPMAALRSALADARRLLDWLGTLPEVDAERIATAGVSMGGILAASLMGMEERVRAGFFVMAGGGLAEILYDSTERPVRAFRDRLLEKEGLETREAFVEFVEPFAADVDPLHRVVAIPPERVLLISARFDRVIPPEASEALWEALGRPTWIRVPTGHYQLLPFFWWAIARGADHLDAVFAEPAPEGSGDGFR